MPDAAETMPAQCDEFLESVATVIARRRMEFPVRAYTLADAIDDNDRGWTVQYLDGPVKLPPHVLDAAWSTSDRMLRAWA
jgi:hypothetical protein